MNITKNWFYKVSQEEIVAIWDNLTVSLYDDWETLENISVWENSTVEYFSFFSEEWTYRKVFLSDKENSKIEVKSLIYSENNKLDVKIVWDMTSNNTQNFTDILSFAWDKWEIALDWILDIWKALIRIKKKIGRYKRSFKERLLQYCYVEMSL